ncbi:MAG: hypothetical protein JW861_08225 [Bacteroidales bacterium]|nr:hypothetical protein [Bacteroidales bacterium]
MIRNSFLVLITAGMAWILLDAVSGYQSREYLNDLSGYYATSGPEETGAANLVTAVVVTYRGLDTLGEVTILFLTATIIGFMLRTSKRREGSVRRATSEVLVTASNVLIPVIFLIGVYIFLNGHLTPGGGFQGGAVLASAMILWIMSQSGTKVSHSLLEITEAISGFGFVFLGLLGIILAGGFLDNTFLSLGTFGKLISAGAIPVIYSLIGLKVGAELSNIILVMNETQEAEQ